MSRLATLSIRSLILLITLVVALPAGGIILYAGIQFRTKMLEDAGRETVKLTDRIASEQQNLTTGAEQVMTVLAQLPEVRRQDTTQVEPILRDLLKLNPRYLNISLSDRTGTVWASALPVTKPFSVADRRYFKNALERGRFSSGEYIVTRSNNQPGITLAYPLNDARGAGIGVVGISFSLERYRQMLEGMQLPAGTSFTIIDHRGLILSRGINPGPYIGKPYMTDEFKKMQTGPPSGTSVRSGFAGDQRIISYRKLYLAGESTPYMYVTAGIPVEIAAREATKSLRDSMVCLTSFLLLACAAAVLIGKRAIVDRFKLLEDASQRLAAGDLQVRVSDLVVGGELGSLGKRFDFMAEELAKRETERLKAQEERDRLILIMETTTDVVCLASPQGKVLYLNRAGRRLTGIGEGALGALHIAGLHPEWAAELILQTAIPAAIREGVWEGESALLGANAREIPVSQLVLSHYDARGNLSHLSTILRDISERKLVEHELEHKRYLLNETQKLAHLGSWELDLVSGLFSWSEEVYRIFETAPGSFAGTYRAFLETVHPEDRERVQKTCQKSVREAAPFEMEHRLLMPDGRVKIIQERGEAVSRAGAVLRCLGSVQDITELRLVEEEQRKLAHLVEMSRDFISIASLKGDIIYLNNAGVALVELESCQEACTKKIIDFFPEGSAAAGADILQELGRLGYWGGDATLRNFGTGDPIAVEMTLFTIADEAGRPIAYANVSRDVRDRKAAEAEHDLLTEQFIQAQKMESIGQLAGGVAHDFNNLLTPIFGYAELLKGDLGGRDAPLAKVANIQKAAEKAKDLVQQLLIFSRKQALEMKTIDLGEVVAGFQSILRHTIRESIDIRICLPAEQYSIRADRNKIEQVIMNLAVNAQDAISGCGVINIEAAPVLLDDEYARQHPEIAPGRYLMLALSDDGCGMDQETRQRIFEPFFTTKGVGKGTGLGLATVYGIVRQHGGSLWVISDPGKGTTFKCYFPLVDEAPQHEPATLQGGTVTLAGKRRTVLLVEDNDMVRNFVDELLVRKGFEVLAAEDPEKALLLAQKSTFELLITDVVMPHMTGFELYARLSERYPGLKVLYMSGYTNDVLGRIADAKVHFVQKPFAINDFARLVETLLGT
jgi:PAS domain S-box-containing protein